MAEVKKQASNIDEQGNVKYLDQERLDRKVVGFPPYKNKPNGLGIFNWILEHVLYMSDKRWPLALLLYKAFVRFSVWMKKGGIRARIYKTIIMLYPDKERPTSTIVMPLNVDAEPKGINEKEKTLSLNLDIMTGDEMPASVDEASSEDSGKSVAENPDGISDTEQLIRETKEVNPDGISDVEQLIRETKEVNPNRISDAEQLIKVNENLSKQAEKVVVPMDMIKESLKKVEYIAGMDSCLCRDANDCKDYPHDLGCLFLGEAAKVVVKHKLGRRFTYEEACARVDEAARVGLMGQAVWIEVEQMLWGVRNDMMDHFLEICFCCPCCCIAMRLARNATENERHRFHPSGWTAVPDRTKCVGCRKCATETNGCPVEAISFGEDGKVIINQESCVGCGICKSRCNLDAIKLKQTMPMRADLQEYFRTDYSLDLKLN